MAGLPTGPAVKPAQGLTGGTQGAQQPLGFDPPGEPQRGDPRFDLPWQLRHRAFDLRDAQAQWPGQLPQILATGEMSRGGHVRPAACRVREGDQLDQ